MGSKSSTKQKTNEVQTVTPPSWAQPQMEAIAQGIMHGVNTIAGVPKFTGDFVTQPGALQTAVPGAFLQAAQMAQSLVPQAQHALDLSGQMPTFDFNNLLAATQGYGTTNPAGMLGAVNAAIDPVKKTLLEQILPQLASSGIESGAYGGSRSQITLPELALRDFSGQAGNIAAELGYKDYTDTANRMLQAYGLSTERGLGTANVLTDRLGLTPELLDSIMRMSGGSAELRQQAAAADMANRDAATQNALQKYQYSMSQPFMGYDIATDLISRLAGNYGTQTSQGTSTTTQKSGGLAPIIGGALGLASTVAGFPMAGGGSAGGSLVSQLFGRKS